MNNTDFIFKQGAEYGGREFIIKDSTLVVSRAWKDGVITKIFKFSDIDPDYHTTKQFVWASYIRSAVALFLAVFVSLLAWIVTKILSNVSNSYLDSFPYTLFIICALAFNIGLLISLYQNCNRVETAVFMDKNGALVFKVHRPYRKSARYDDKYDNLYRKVNPEDYDKYDVFIKILTEKIRASEPSEVNQDTLDTSVPKNE